MNTETRINEAALVAAGLVPEATKGAVVTVDFARQPGAEVDTARAELKSAKNERDGYKEQLDDIKDRLLPDDSPCKHDETGYSLYDDIADLLNERVKYKSIYNEVFGIFYSAGFHNGTVQDNARAAVAELATLRGANEQLRTALENYRYICPCGGTGAYIDGPPEDPQPRECEWCYAARQALSTPSPTSNEESLRKCVAALTDAQQVMDLAMQTLLTKDRISVMDAQFVDALHHALNSAKRALSTP